MWLRPPQISVCCYPTPRCGRFVPLPPPLSHIAAATMSSSDDDISLAALAARATGKPMPTVVRQASTTISRQHAAALQQAKPAVPAARAGSASASRPGVKRKAPPVVSRPDDSSDDSDSDVPLSSLAKQAKGRATAAGSRSTQSSSAAAAKAKAPKRASSGVNTTKRPRTLQVDKQKVRDTATAVLCHLAVCA